MAMAGGGASRLPMRGPHTGINAFAADV